MERYTENIFPGRIKPNNLLDFLNTRDPSETVSIGENHLGLFLRIDGDGHSDAVLWESVCEKDKKPLAAPVKNPEDTTPHAERCFPGRVAVSDLIKYLNLKSQDDVIAIGENYQGLFFRFRGDLVCSAIRWSTICRAFRLEKEPSARRKCQEAQCEDYWLCSQE